MNSIGVPPVIEARIYKLEEAVESESNDAFDHAKALVETVCKTVLIDLGVQIEVRWDLPRLIREVLNSIPMIAASHPNANDARERLQTMQRGLTQTVQGLAEMRNLAGWTSHGPDGYMEPLDRIHIRLAAMSADTLTCFLLSLHRKYVFPSEGGRVHFEDYPEFNEYVDEMNPYIAIFDSIFSPSEILYMADIEHVAYKEYLIEYMNQPEEDSRQENQ